MMTKLTRLILTTTAASVALSAILISSACAKEVGASDTPSKAIISLLELARAEDEPNFKLGLSKNFQHVIERYQELGESKPELRGAFSVGTFMRAFKNESPVPKEEQIKGTTAIVRAQKKDGVIVETKLLLEGGSWKLEVPDGLVRNLDHFDEVAALATGDAVEPTPEVKTGGGGKADRVKALPADATDEMKAKAGALDQFDLGDLAGAEKTLDAALQMNPGDEELTVALGRAFVQTGAGPKAIKLFEAYLAKNAKAVPARHYLGMAYMFEKRPADAAAMWRKIGEIDPAYSKQFRLEERARIAEDIAAGKDTAPPGPHGGGGAPGPASAPAGGAPGH